MIFIITSTLFFRQIQENSSCNVIDKNKTKEVNTHKGGDLDNRVEELLK